MIAAFDQSSNQLRLRLRKRPLIPCTIKDSAEPQIVMVETVDVIFDIPTYAYKLLDPASGYELHLPSCSVINERDVDVRANSWKRPQTTVTNGRAPAKKTLAKQMIGMGLTMTVRVRFKKSHWPFIIMLTERLGITVAEWCLGGVGYAVWLKEQTVQFEGMVERGASK